MGAEMRIGYARTSTVEQKAGLEAQLRDLKKAEVEKIFQEQLSSVDSKREQLEAAIDFCREGDVLVCTKLDRLARSVADVVKNEERLRKKGAALQIMDPTMDTSTPAGRFTFNVLASIAQFEREIMLTRQREGIAKAKGENKYKGRAPTARSRADRILELSKAGLNAKDIVAAMAKELDRKGKPIKISERSVYRVLADSKGTLKQAA
jgi:DNA invertase Pin-like site-specific DNA recombinase